MPRNMPQGGAVRLAASVLALALIAGGCNTVPLTNRSQLQLFSPQQMAAMGTEAYGEILGEETLLKSGPEVDQVLRVGRRIARAAEEGTFDWPERGTFQWEFRVVRNDKVVNAWALPGGKVAVYTGILPVTRTDAGLATVLGHEIAHAIARHGGERFSHQGIAAVGEKGLELLIESRSPQAQGLFRSAFGIGAQVGYLLPFSRTHESEADHIGLLLMAAAAYDPREAVAFWRRMESEGGRGAPPEWLSTHPSHDSRIRDLEGWLPEALAIYQGRRPLSRIRPERPPRRIATR